MAESEAKEEIRWSRRAAQQTDPRIAIWLKVRHGGQRTSDVAKEYGYSDSSGAYRVAQRLEFQATKDHDLEHQLSMLRRQLSDVRS